MIETERLRLRENLPEDLHKLHELLSDRDNMYFLDDITTNTIEETAQNLQQAIANADGHYFCIEDKFTNEYIGQLGYTITQATPIGNVVHMGYFIMPRHQRKGYTAEAAKAAIAYAFGCDNVIRITTACYGDNIPSMKVMEKVGFRREGVKIKAQWHDGKMKDRLEYAINKDEYNIM